MTHPGAAHTRWPGPGLCARRGRLRLAVELLVEGVVGLPASEDLAFYYLGRGTPIPKTPGGWPSWSARLPSVACGRSSSRSWP
ncbi:MAG: hypothetical protein ACM3ZF_10930 [Mycobacterium leprae]